MKHSITKRLRHAKQRIERSVLTFPNPPTTVEVALMPRSTIFYEREVLFVNLPSFRHRAGESECLCVLSVRAWCAALLVGFSMLAAMIGNQAKGQEGAPNKPNPPWPPQYKAGGTAADVLGPDGRTWFPNWTAVGVQSGAADIKPFAPIEQFGGRADDDADDAQALKDACNAAGCAGGGAVLPGEGTYHLDHKVLITHNGVVIRGRGRDKTKVVIRYNGTDDSIKDGIIAVPSIYEWQQKHAK